MNNFTAEWKTLSEATAVYKHKQWQPSVTNMSHDKTNKVSVRPAKTQISLGIRPV